LGGKRQRSEIRDQRSEVRDQRTEDRGQRSEIRDQRSEDGKNGDSLFRVQGLKEIFAMSDEKIQNSRI